MASWPCTNRDLFVTHEVQVLVNLRSESEVQKVTLIEYFYQGIR